MKGIICKIKRKLVKLRLQPIHVYCLHHVCESFDSESMHQGDWIEIQPFKEKVIYLQQKGITFISMTEAYKKITNDYFRLKKYAVLTFDDGYSSTKEILLWLKEHSIPVTLFVNTDYADGKAYRDTDKERYLTRQDLSSLEVEIGMHGIQHKDVTTMFESELKNFVDKTIAETSKIQGFIPFWAYTWGSHSELTSKILREYNITPVNMDGEKNYCDYSCIHRELFD